MKSFRFIIAVTVLVGVLGCSTPTPTSKNAIGHHSDFAAAAMIEDAKRLFEDGKIDAAEQKLLSVLAIEPNNRKAYYYLALVKESQYKREASQRSQKFWGYYPTYPPKPIYQ
jgi:Tfp pilus assembly protein PilF